jgi:cobalt-zinc-cadmium efflux system membrane fusion protein
VKQLAIVWMAFLAVCLAGCKTHASQPSDGDSSKSPDPLAIKVTPALRKQIRIGEPTWADVADKLRVAGHVAADETRMARVGSSVAGRITTLLVVEGERVRQGQTIATVRSTELSDAQFSYVKAASQQQLADRAASRAKQLLNADVIGTAELQRREGEALQAAVEKSALRQQLGALGLTEEAIQQLEATHKLNAEYRVTASIGGTLLERKVTVGQIVQPAEAVFTVADLSNVWLIADIPEQEAGAIEVGKAVEAEIPALPQQTIRGKLDFVSNTVNPDTRTVRVRMNLPNPRHIYKPAMLATITLEDRARRRQVIPSTAVVREDNREQVFVQTGADSFVLRPVNLGGEFGEYRVLTDGIQSGEKIVVDGAFHLNNQRKQQALQGNQQGSE